MQLTDTFNILFFHKMYEMKVNVLIFDLFTILRMQLSILFSLNWGKNKDVCEVI